MSENSGGGQEISKSSSENKRGGIHIFHVLLEGVLRKVEVNEELLRKKIFERLNIKKIPHLSSISTSEAVTFTYKDDKQLLGHYDSDKMVCNINVSGIARTIDKAEDKIEPVGFLKSLARGPSHSVRITKVGDLNFALNTVFEKECSLIFDSVAPLVDIPKWRSELIASYVAPFITTGLAISRTLTIVELSKLMQVRENIASLHGLLALFLFDFTAQAFIDRLVLKRQVKDSFLLRAVKSAISDINPFRIGLPST